MDLGREAWSKAKEPFSPVLAEELSGKRGVSRETLK